MMKTSCKHGHDLTADGACYDNGECIECQRRRTLKSRYGISIEQYESMFVQQDGRCAICKEISSSRSLDVDHDHSCCPGRRSCGRCIRALLCGKCNQAIGLFGDNQRIVLEAALYLEMHRNGF